MLHTYFFMYNIPADNHLNGQTDNYVNILAEWYDTSFFKDGRPIVTVMPVNFSFADCIRVKNWLSAHNDITRLAETHFAEIAKQKRIEDAQNILKEINAAPVNILQ